MAFTTKQQQPEEKAKIETHSAPEEERDPQAHHSMRIVGNQVSGKNETRLFQTAGDTKEWLTQDEAKKRGFYWKSDAPAKQNPIQGSKG